MTLPTRIKVMGQRLTVKRFRQLTTESKGEKIDLAGAFENEIKQISLLDGLAAEREREVVLHESIHAMLCFAGLLPDHEDQEDVVARLSPVMLDFLRANKPLITYLQEVAR